MAQPRSTPQEPIFRRCYFVITKQNHPRVILHQTCIDCNACMHFSSQLRLRIQVWMDESMITIRFQNLLKV